MRSNAATVSSYLQSLPPDRRRAISALRALILQNLPTGYHEVMQWGMICWIVPLSRYPATYNGQPLAIAALSSQKSSMSLYLMAVYGNKDIETWFIAEYRKSGKKLNMGKSCVRFRSLDDLPLDLIGRCVSRVTVTQYIKGYEKAKGKPAAGRKA